MSTRVTDPEQYRNTQAYLWQQELEEQHRTANERLVALTSLTEHPGWRLFQEYVDAAHKMHLGKALAAPEAHQMATALGRAAAYKDAQEWLVGQVAALRHTLETRGKSSL